MLSRPAVSLAVPQTSMIPESLLPPDGKVDIFAVHSRLNAEEHRRVLAEDAKWVTIVREPASLFESLYTYYGIGRWYKLDLTELTNFPMEVREPVFFSLSFSLLPPPSNRPLLSAGGWLSISIPP